MAMAKFFYFLLLLTISQAALFIPAITTQSETNDSGIEKANKTGTRWALLVAGSDGYGNYRHQSDVCHAYQILKKGGLKDENIVVMMFDDIAKDEMNPRPGIIINHPKGKDVYAGVPKDYTGKHVTAKNFYAVLLGDKKAVKGGSGKVIDSKPNDHIFVYYTDHGGPGVLGMPNVPYVYGDDFVQVLKKKHASGTYKEMVIYVEACDSGSIFDGIMPKNLSIYITTASKPDESSWGTYCPDTKPPPPPEYLTCLGDLYSISWMEDSESHDLKKETLKRQYEVVKKRTSNNGTYRMGSHVIEFGDKTISDESLYQYQGFNPTNEGITGDKLSENSIMGVVDQRDAELLFLWKRYELAKNGVGNETELLKEITKTIMYRNHLDNSVKLIGEVLYGPERGLALLSAVRPSGQPLVDDWSCLKSMVRVFETECGLLTQYGMKHMRAFANICNSGISEKAVKAASKVVCNRENMEMRGPWKGYSA